MNIGELFVTLGVKAQTKTLKDFAGMLADLPVSAAAGIAALAGIEYKMLKLAEQAIDVSKSLQMFTSQTGLSAHELQKWQIVAEQANVSADAVQSSIVALERSMAEIRLGRGNIAPFQLLGIGVNQNAFAVLDQLRQRIKGVDAATATNIISQMGLDPSMIQVLRLSNAEFAKLASTVSGMSDETQGSFLRAKKHLVEFGLVARYLSFEVLGHLADALTLIWEKLSQFKVAIYGAGVALAALAAYFFPITAAVVGLLVVLDDLAVYFKGGNSVFGMAMDGLTKLAGKVQGMSSGLSMLGKLAAAMPIVPIGILPMMAQKAMGNAATAVTQTNTIHVHSTAPADEVGKAVKREVDRGVSAAALQTDNEGF